MVTVSGILSETRVAHPRNADAAMAVMLAGMITLPYISGAMAQPIETSDGEMLGNDVGRLVGATVGGRVGKMVGAEVTGPSVGIHVSPRTVGAWEVGAKDSVELVGLVVGLEVVGDVVGENERNQVDVEMQSTVVCPMK